MGTRKGKSAEVEACVIVVVFVFCGFRNRFNRAQLPVVKVIHEEEKIKKKEKSRKKKVKEKFTFVHVFKQKKTLHELEC